MTWIAVRCNVSLFDLPGNTFRFSLGVHVHCVYIIVCTMRVFCVFRVYIVCTSWVQCGYSVGTVCVHSASE